MLRAGSEYYTNAKAKPLFVSVYVVNVESRTLTILRSYQSICQSAPEEYILVGYIQDGRWKAS